jgi:hypothetical protein
VRCVSSSLGLLSLSHMIPPGDIKETPSEVHYRLLPFFGPAAKSSPINLLRRSKDGGRLRKPPGHFLGGPPVFLRGGMGSRTGDLLRASPTQTPWAGFGVHTPPATPQGVSGGTGEMCPAGPSTYTAVGVGSVYRFSLARRVPSCHNSLAIEVPQNQVTSGTFLDSHAAPEAA